MRLWCAVGLFRTPHLRCGTDDLFVYKMENFGLTAEASKETTIRADCI